MSCRTRMRWRGGGSTTSRRGRTSTTGSRGSRTTRPELQPPPQAAPRAGACATKCSPVWPDPFGLQRVPGGPPATPAAVPAEVRRSTGRSCSIPIAKRGRSPPSRTDTAFAATCCRAKKLFRLRVRLLSVSISPWEEKLRTPFMTAPFCRCSVNDFLSFPEQALKRHA